MNPYPFNPHLSSNANSSFLKFFAISFKSFVWMFLVLGTSLTAYSQSGGITGNVYVDLSGTGSYVDLVDIPGKLINISLTDSGGGVTNSVTGIMGEFVFSGLSDGIYTITLDQTDPQFPTGFDAISDPDGIATLYTADITISGGAILTNQNFTFQDIAPAGCPTSAPEGAPVISDSIAYCVSPGSLFNVSLKDSSSAQNESLEYIELVSTLPAGVTFDEVTGIITFDPDDPGVTGLCTEVQVKACQVVDQECLTYSGTCVSKASGISFIYVGEEGNDVYIFDSGTCTATGTPLACESNLSYGDTVIWSGNVGLSNIDIYVVDSATDCSSFACGTPTLTQHISCNTLYIEVMGRVIANSLLAFAATGNNKKGTDPTVVLPVGEPAMVYCSDTVTVKFTVNGTTLPITCPADITVFSEAGICGITDLSVLGTPMIEGSCGIPTITNDAGTMIPVGVNSITWTVTDACGNTGTCSQMVTVVDNINPTITLPSDVTVYSEAGTCEPTIVNYDITTSDNCEVLSVDLTAGQLSGREFIEGTTTNTYIVTDVNGNTSITSFDITVICYAGSIGDQLFVDLDNDGVFDPAKDLAIANVTVTLTSPSGFTVTVSTDADGNYSFDNLPLGDYTVTVDVADVDFPAGVTNSVDADGGNDNTSTITLTAAEPSDLDQDFGYKGAGSIGDQLFVDVNGDGIYTKGVDEPITDIDVIITYPNGFMETVSSDINGNYSFDNLPLGEYTVTVVETDLDFPTDLINTIDPDLTNDGSTIVTLTEIAPITDVIDFGYVSQVELGDLVWLDINADGVKDLTEDGINGIIVRLYKEDGSFVAETTTVTSSITGNDGSYLFTGLQPGDYYVEFVTTGYLVSPSTGTNEENDSDITDANGAGTTDVFSLSSGMDELRIDAGLYETYSIGDILFHDVNGNGIKDDGELGIDGLEVALVNAGGDTLATDVTSGGGIYGFDGITSNDYEIRFSLPDGYAFTIQDAGRDDLVDSDVDARGSTGVFAFDILSGNDLSIDAGVYIPVNLGNYVWNDEDGDGIQDDLETGIAFVTVTLRDSEGNFVASDETGSAGDYEFLDLIPGDYYLDFTYPGSYIPSSPEQGGDTTIDSDITGANGANTTDVFTLVSGVNNPDIDAGIYVPSSIGDFIWFDENGDGIYNKGDTGLAGVTVYLISVSGDTLASDITGTDGDYLFDNLSAGAYYIGVETLHGMTPTTAVEGTNRGMDSDLTQANGMNTTSIFLVAAGVKLMDIDLGFENIVVPVEMLYFEGANRGQDHLLNWATSIEIDNDFFELQRKINGERQFEIIGSVNGMGNALSLNEYQFIDRDVLQAGHYEYRLRQVDYNGNFEFSDVITIDRKETERDILIYPNPAISYLNINFTEQIDKGAILSILDLSGKLIRTFEVEDGSSNINIDISEFTAGTYFITVNGNGYNFNSKFIKVD